MTAVSPEMRAEIGQRLDVIEAEEEVRILLAIESGSRAWGFHSTDSDYDVRFVYARPIDWHMRVRSGRDVVERPISDALDLSGWDLRKTLGLMLGSNAVALEWLQSPIRYREVPGFAHELLAFGRRVLRRRPVMWHYLRLAERQMERLRTEDGRVRLKPYFYTVRPVLALRWLRLRAEAAVPPMDMARLLDEAQPDASVTERIQALIEEKRAAEGALSSATLTDIDAMIGDEIAEAKAELGDGRPEMRGQHSDEADDMHIRWTRAMEEVWQ
ncbi:MAG: nucleotidyltransferase domain-containing protein [Pseudomonadota bacterium]